MPELRLVHMICFCPCQAVTLLAVAAHSPGLRVWVPVCVVLTEKAKGVKQNAVAGKKGGKIAKDARLALENKTGRKVITGENFLPAPKQNKKL